MKKERIMITLSLDFGLNEMGFESSLTRQEISIDNPELTGLSIREFCMLTKEQLLSAYGLTPEKVSAIERLLSEYSLRLGMTDAELDAYLDRYYKDNPREKEFYDLCDKMCGRLPFDEHGFREELGRELNASPLSGNPLNGNRPSGDRLNDLGWQRYQTVREAYLRQPWYMRWFGSRKSRIRKAVEDATVIHDMFCRLVTENCIETERWRFEQREINKIMENR